MHTGGCLCGTVRFEIHGPISNIVYCHCSLCRKAQGSAFATNGVVMAGDFKIVTGVANLTGYESSAGQTKYFCKTCGSPVISKNATHQDRVRVRLGLIDSVIDERPVAHIFVKSKANWEEITGRLPQYASYEPGRHTH